VDRETLSWRLIGTSRRMSGTMRREIGEERFRVGVTALDDVGEPSRGAERLAAYIELTLAPSCRSDQGGCRATAQVRELAFGDVVLAPTGT